MKQQDSLILQLRAAEQSARTDVRGMKKMEAEESSNRHRNEQLLVEAEQKIKLAEYSVETSKKRNFELQSRCDELSTQWEMERKLRYFLYSKSSHFLRRVSIILTHFIITFVTLLFLIQNGSSARAEIKSSEEREKR